MFVLFNVDRQFIGYSEDIPDLPSLNIFKLEIPKGQDDLSSWEWKGDMFVGKMVKKNKINN